MRRFFWSIVFCGVCALASCDKQPVVVVDDTTDSSLLYLGADLSYVNEMEDCGGTYQLGGVVTDPFDLFAVKGSNLVRVRLWHSPDWTAYSTITDVEKTIRRAKSAGMDVLLDVHYSDKWADPSEQIRPKAWSGITDNAVLGDSVYAYTYATLDRLASKGLLPTIVQVGNEINREVLQEENMQSTSINWGRNVLLLNRGLSAVVDFSAASGTVVETMIHIAQPENALWWFKEAVARGLQSFDWIGLSYYPKWSSYPLTSLSRAVDSLVTTYGKRLMVVETAYPHTLSNKDNANNILGQDALITGYPATPDGQLHYLTDLVAQVVAGGGSGVVYWEPAWISTGCTTLWGTGSHWDNATFFDAYNGNEALPAFDFYSQAY
ncbi:MAG: arabinogalactan endo-1,4-beta-galactosidase [Cyclobacteriaceae bacterium]|nr:arabinogalactan endo-1,4-beta-galactosidase [Cyclobacteriaceae bacterium]